MRQWFYANAGEQRGPVSEQELLQLIESKRIPAETMVWAEGLPDWTKASSLSEFAPSPYATPQTDINPEIVWDDYTPSGPQVRPWVRYWARTIDFFVFSITTGAVLGIAAPQVLEMNDTLSGLVLLVVYNFVEPAMFAFCGTTPMKWLLNVRVRNAAGNKLSYGMALNRVFKIWLRGEGLGIPLVSLFTQLSAYNTLKNQGITSWDREASIQVSHKPIEWWRWTAMVMVLIGIISLIGLGQEGF